MTKVQEANGLGSFRCGRGVEAGAGSTRPTGEKVLWKRTERQTERECLSARGRKKEEIKKAIRSERLASLHRSLDSTLDSSHDAFVSTQDSRKTVARAIRGGERTP